MLLKRTTIPNGLQGAFEKKRTLPMSNYHRNFAPGACYFFTQVTYHREPWLCEASTRVTLREAIVHVRRKHPFTIEAWVLLPDHLHCLWRLPERDSDYSTRWSLIKSWVTNHMRPSLLLAPQATSRTKRGEKSLWQRRFWEHTIRNDQDYRAHCDYIHFNPVKHSFCQAPKDWLYSSFHRFVKEGRYEVDWGSQSIPVGIDIVGGE